jgi:hypothetical protein
VLGILIKDRIKEAGKTQKVLSKHRHLISSRFGFHEVSSARCSRVGMILLQLKGDQKEWQLLESELQQIEGIELQNMEFDT